MFENLNINILSIVRNFDNRIITKMFKISFDLLFYRRLSRIAASRIRSIKTKNSEKL